MRRIAQGFSAAAMLAVSATPALAHTGIGQVSGAGFAVGFVHPLLGLDHLLAMLGVGVWAAQSGGRAAWLVPASFLAAMIAGACLAVSEVSLPLVEFGVGGSVLVIGGLIAFGARLPLALVIGLAGLFALFHGHAHGSELPSFAQPMAYGAGFLLATALLHAVGFGLAFTLRTHAARMPLRVGGAIMAAIGGGLPLAS